MKDSQNVAMIIKNRAKGQGVSIGKMLEECEMSKNALSSMQSGGYMPRIENICKIADYLDCSVDYLLGRTDTPNTTTNINGNGNHHNVQANDNSTINIGKPENDGLRQEFIKMFDELSRDDKIDVLSYIKSLKKNKE